jgi:hypothetical protein
LYTGETIGMAFTGMSAASAGTAAVRAQIAPAASQSRVLNVLTVPPPNECPGRRMLTCNRGAIGSGKVTPTEISTEKR